MAAITLEHVEKTYGTGHAAVREVNLAIRDRELLVLVGPSGSGKSTVLRLIAGLEHPTAGRILIDGDDVTAVPPERRDLAMVFQSYALYPHKSVRENLGFGLKMRGVPAAAVRERVQQAAAALGIDALLDRKPAQLSGGQRQRVALGRAIVREPRAFLLDEPLSNLDPSLRDSTRTELSLLHRRLGTTMVYVTHDQAEAMTLATTIAVMQGGQVEQVGPPAAIYEQPANVFVAQFFGSPAMNVWRCQGVQRGDAAHAICGALEFDLPAGVRMSDTQAVLVGVRPHDIAVAPVDAGDARGRVAVVEPLGATVIVHVRLDGATSETVRVVAQSDCGVSVGDVVGLRLGRDRVHLFDASSGVRL